MNLTVRYVFSSAPYLALPTNPPPRFSYLVSRFKRKKLEMRSYVPSVGEGRASVRLVEDR